MTSYTSAKTKFNSLNEELRGILIMLAASFFFSTMGFFIKLIARHHTTFEIVFFRNIVSLFIIGTTLMMFKPKGSGGRPFLLVMRGVFGFCAMFCYFYSISVLPLATASTFNKTSPIFTAILAGILLKEKSGGKVWGAVLVGFAGVMFIMRPSHNVPLLGAAAGLMGGVIAAMAYTSIRKLAEYYDARVIVMSFSIAGLTGSSVYFIMRMLQGDPRYLSTQFIPHGMDLFYVIMVGALASLAQWMMSVAYKYGRASVISTINYFGIIFATVYGYVAGDGWPGAVSFAGIGLVVLSGVLVGVARQRSAPKRSR